MSNNSIGADKINAESLLAMGFLETQIKKAVILIKLEMGGDEFVTLVKKAWGDKKRRKMRLGLSHPLPVGSRPVSMKKPRLMSWFFGGGHGTRTHGAVTPYSLSRRAP